MSKKPPTNASSGTTQVQQPDQLHVSELNQEIDTLRRLMRRYRRAAVAAVLAGVAKAATGAVMIDHDGTLWWLNLGWAAAVLAGGGYLAAPHLRRLLELTDPARPARHASGPHVNRSAHSTTLLTPGFPDNEEALKLTGICPRCGGSIRYYSSPQPLQRESR